jgi:hypothetical protein
VLFVEKGLGSNILSCNRADPADRVVMGVGHSRQLSSVRISFEREVKELGCSSWIKPKTSI